MRNQKANPKRQKWDSEAKQFLLFCSVSEQHSRQSKAQQKENNVPTFCLLRFAFCLLILRGTQQ
jgi:hypothetical protein